MNGETIPTLRTALERLLAHQDLEEPQAQRVLGALAAAEAPPALAGALLAALRAKGVTAAEVRGFAAGMRSLARRPELPCPVDAIDLVGTGGDASGSLNLSTGAALLAAACGARVVKHGNRSISSRCGSADLVEALGLALPLDEAAAARLFEATGFTFLFAPYYHPAMKAIGPVRSALGVRTIFNLLGPLTNPAAPRLRLIGAYDAASAQLIAETIAGLEVTRAWVVHGAAGWDEATPIGSFIAFEVADGRVRRLEIDPLDLGLARCTPADLAGGDATRNAAALIDVFERRDRGPHRAALLLQSGIALHLAGLADSPRSGINLAASALEDGRAADWLARWRALAANANVQAGLTGRGTT
ncbi:MAG: anthranilate phosphoribosyltransferase [Gammaproteobacteria bacterium]|nr:anthranilate phosphoribosyltransferase [Gammaproteobacteria bacterium]